ncbi:SGNH/GDSL hydrolase family protein [Luteibacter yeojuensis]|uniref:Capsular biosynthesis protein n=1 Tax=Luteibacter yeojuensis TaxID=345309 RepID=A0A7X5QTS9_9GAMM|nr:SGNH/GDSL hydrolase family protein [Luteibacter yeojuensis]NID15298.1 capsular biosynthesis protein [Luteibacter yeojuensis]
MFRTCLILAACLFAANVPAANRIVLPEHPSADQRKDIEHRLNDWPDLGRYAKDNAALAPPKPGEKRVVFMGDSITDFWGRSVGTFFPGRPYVNRGISGQTTPQMLIRFRADVIALKPAVVVILAGTNDIAGNTGPETLAAIEDNLASMTDLARAHGIRVAIASLMPVNDDVVKDQTVQRPPETIRALNAWIKAYAAREHLVFVDYYTAMVDERGQLKKELSDDGLHPNAAGYEVMSPLAQSAIDKAFGGDPR